jgi:hypothetical protein
VVFKLAKEVVECGELELRSRSNLALKACGCYFSAILGLAPLFSFYITTFT